MCFCFLVFICCCCLNIAINKQTTRTHTRSVEKMREMVRRDREDDADVPAINDDYEEEDVS